MDLLFGATTTPPTTTLSTTAPVLYGSLLDDGLVVPYQDKFGIASIIARDMTLSLFIMMASYNDRPDYPKALMHCDFEDGWCPGFEFETHGDIPWNLHKGPTPSNQTGPDHDHTRFNEYGTYVYVEASKRRWAETAVFRTPAVMMLERPYYCLSYWYNMFGEGMGTLWVYWNAAGEQGINSVVDKHSGMKSDNASHWRESTTTVQSTSVRKFFRPVWFEFRGIRGISYKSDIAIDDILLTPGKCEERPLPKTATTMTFRGITTRPPTTTPVSWKFAHPDWNRCGDDYAHVKKHICCDGAVRPNRGRNIQCCGKKTFNLIHNVCCGASVLWINSHGCCGARVYKKPLQACCGRTMVYNVADEKCVHNNKLEPRNPTTPARRGKRSIEAN